MLPTSKNRTAKTSLPKNIEPMLCTLVKKPFDNPDFLFEVKWDGYRVIGYTENKKARLASRGGQDYTKKYPAVTQALAALKHNCVLDGEVVVLDKNGKPNFDALQRVNGQENAGLIYYVFDVMWLDG